MTWDPNSGGFTPGGSGYTALFGPESASRGVTVQDLINLGLIDANGRSLAGRSVGGTLLNPTDTRLAASISAILQDSASSIELNSPTLFKKMNGAAGVVIGSAGIAGYDSTGTATFTIDPATGNVTLSGTITATAGAIGGFTIGSDYVRDAANSFGLASTVSGGDDVRFWAGSTFESRGTAAFRVTEAGDVTANNATLTGTVSGRSTATLAAAINSSGNLVNDLINARLDSSTKQILSDFNFGTTDYSGAVNAGNVTWNASTGAITGGSGVIVYRKGIVGVAGGVTTFSIDATTGAATFAGALSAATGTFGTITAGTLNGLTFQTATSGARLTINESSNNKLIVYPSSGGAIVEIGGGTGVIWASSSSILQATIQSTATGSGMSALVGASTSGYGLYGSSATGDSACRGESSSTAHGVRGVHSAATATSGLVGANNGYDFYADGGGTNYGPFTGAHDVLYKPASIIDIGDIVIDVLCVARKNISNTLFEVEASSTPGQSGSVGVMAVKSGSMIEHYTPAALSVSRKKSNGKNKDDDRPEIRHPQYGSIESTYHLGACNSLGEGQINVCGEGGNFQVGDLIVTSSMRGKGMHQADNIVRGNTVAKAREAVSFANAAEVKMIACIYLCG